MKDKFSRQTIRNSINKELRACIAQYCESIPMDEIMHCIDQFGGTVVDEAGERWSGIFCGEQGTANMEIVHPDYKKPFYLNLTWYKMQSCRYEIVVYVS